MIRDFKNSDIDAIMQIWLEENIKAHSFVPKEYWERNYDYVKSILPNAEIYVYTNQNETVGFIGLNGSYIEGIFVKSGSRHKGIGTALLNTAKLKNRELMLNVYKKNTKAFNFYQKNGFKILEENIDMETNEQEYTMKWENCDDNTDCRCDAHRENESGTKAVGKI